MIEARIQILKRFLPTHPLRGQNVLDNLKKLARESKPGDIIFFHYSGHGSQLPDQPPSDPHHDEPIPFGEMEGKDDCLCTLPVNAYSNWVRDDFLKEALALAPEGVLFVNNHDACHNGTGEDLVNNSNQTQLSQQKETIKAGVVLISGCLDKQTSADAQTPKRVAEGAETYGYLTWTSSMGFQDFITKFAITGDKSIYSNAADAIENNLPVKSQTVQISWEGNFAALKNNDYTWLPNEVRPCVLGGTFVHPSAQQQTQQPAAPQAASNNTYASTQPAYYLLNGHAVKPTNGYIPQGAQPLYQLSNGQLTYTAPPKPTQQTPAQTSASTPAPSNGITTAQASSLISNLQSAPGAANSAIKPEFYMLNNQYVAYSANPPQGAIAVYKVNGNYTTVNPNASGQFQQAIPAAPPPPQPSQSATQAVPVSQAVPTEVVTSHSAAAPVTTSLPAQHVAQQQPVSFAAQAWNAVNTHFWGPQRAPQQSIYYPYAAQNGVYRDTPVATAATHQAANSYYLYKGNRTGQMKVAGFYPGREDTFASREELEQNRAHIDRTGYRKFNAQIPLTQAHANKLNDFLSTKSDAGEDELNTLLSQVHVTPPTYLNQANASTNTASQVGIPNAISPSAATTSDPVGANIKTLNPREMRRVATYRN